ncbi:MAG TPA: Cof-type HAD-IIB family hydrolase [bacterium]|nr:Cof-type HAD-IIB family hydrolase [bacterium]
MKYRMIVADIDGTLVTGDRQITPGVREAVRAVQAQGVRVCLATGRMWLSAEPYFRRLGADPPAILYNGGLVFDFTTQTVLRQVHLDYDQARAVLETLRAIPEVQPHLYVDNRVYTGQANAITDRYRRKDGLQVEEVGDLVAFLPRNPMKILIIGARPDLERAAGLIRRLPMPINLVFSEETYMEIIPIGSSKGVALQFVAQHLRIPLGAVIAVGDNLNDLEMIQLAGLGVAMGNAPDELKAHADFVTATNEQEGLRHVIERFILAGESTQSAHRGGESNA